MAVSALMVEVMELSVEAEGAALVSVLMVKVNDLPRLIVRKQRYS